MLLAQVPEEHDALKEAARLYCLCERLHNEERAMVGCDSCDNWCDLAGSAGCLGCAGHYERGEPGP